MRKAETRSLLCQFLLISLLFIYEHLLACAPLCLEVNHLPLYPKVSGSSRERTGFFFQYQGNSKKNREN